MKNIKRSVSEVPGLDGAGRIWLGPAGPGPQTRLFRKVLETPVMPKSVLLELYAESIYHLWVNGRYVRRGPEFHHPHRRPVTAIELGDLWREGRNVLAVLVHTRNIPTHNSVPSGAPGLIGRLTVTEASGEVSQHVTDATWRATDKTGWRSDVPRRNWALGQVEAFDATAAPKDWEGCEYDDSDWDFAEVLRPAGDIPQAVWIDPKLPHLKASWQPVRQIVGLYQAPAAAQQIELRQGSSAYGKFLTNFRWAPASTLKLAGRLDDDDGVRIEGLTPDSAAMLWADLGQEYVGQVIFDADLPTAGTIDVCWSERFLDSPQPALLVKGTPYADRITAGPGPLRWEPIGFSGARYVGLILSGFTGTVAIRRLGMRATEPQLNWAGRFECDDERLNGVWKLCERSIRVGTQEGLMDCPTREQASYVGDGHPVARWIGMLSGDYSYWRYLVTESFARQARSGLIRTSVFSGTKRSLIDYVLLAVIGTLDYLRHTGDTETVRQVLPGCRRVFDWFDAYRDAQGLLQLGLEKIPTLNETPWEQSFDPDGWDEPWGAMLFIDHPGIGWHGKSEPGIDRRGTNAAINAIYVVALRALAELEEAFDGGRAESLRLEARKTASAAGKAFFNEAESAFADGVGEDGELLRQISQQTNTWCLWAGLCDKDRTKAVIRRILREPDAAMARSGPYFWYYMFPLLAAEGMHELALEHIRRLWGPMLDAGATTLWETFVGDEDDTWCHPWAGAPLEFLMTEILGLDPISLRSGRGVLQPRTDLLGSASGSIVLPAGPVSIQWKPDGKGGVELSGELPEGLAADLHGPGGELLKSVRGSWSFKAHPS